jgi:acyl carrier protein
MAISETDILDQVRDLMIDLFDQDDLMITEATTADDVEGWDSLHHIRLIVAIERRFKVRFAAQEVESLKNVGDLVRLIDRKRVS